MTIRSRRRVTRGGQGGVDRRAVAGAKSQPSRAAPTVVGAGVAGARAGDRAGRPHLLEVGPVRRPPASGSCTVMMLFSCRVQASSVKLVDPVHTAAVPVRAASSRTTYLECISCPPARIGLVCTAVPREVLADPVGGAGRGRVGLASAAKSAAVAAGRFAGVVGDPHRHAAVGRRGERPDDRRGERGRSAGSRRWPGRGSGPPRRRSRRSGRRPSRPARPGRRAWCRAAGVRRSETTCRQRTTDRGGSAVRRPTAGRFSLRRGSLARCRP